MKIRKQDVLVFNIDSWESIMKTKEDDLLEAVHTEKIDAIDKLIEDIYEQRKVGLATEGEYSLQNLLFKDFRNKGYLDKLKELKNELIGKELSLESLTEAVDELDESILKEDQEFGKHKDKFIRAILSQDATALHKGAESGKIYNRQTGELEDNLLWDSVLHHIDGDPENNPFDFSNYTLIQCDNYSTAMLIHKLIHLLSFAENESAAEDIKNKIRRYDAEFVTLINNRLNIQDFDSWWKDSGHIILDSAADKELSLEEALSTDKKTDTLKKIFRASTELADAAAILWSQEEEDLDEIAKDIRCRIADINDIAETIGNLPDAELEEDTIKQNGKWVNKGKEGTHGAFKTKKAADAQRKVMFANGFSESLNEDATADIQDNKVRDEKYKGITIGSILSEEDLNKKIKDYSEDRLSLNTAWLATHKLDGSRLNAPKSKKSATNLTSVVENLDRQQRDEYNNELSRIAFTQVIIQDNGLFNIYNIKETDIDRVVNQIRNLDYIDWVNKNAGKYDFSKAVMFGQPQPRYYNIVGQIKN